MKQIRIGSKFDRKMGNVVSHVTVIEKISDDKFKCVTATGKTFVAKKESVKKWERVVRNPTPRLNKKSFVNVLIDTLEKTHTPMTARELIEEIKKDNSFSFKSTAKTPSNSASARLNSYIRVKGNQALIKKVNGQVGTFVHV